jgi:hypothetical protein
MKCREKGHIFRNCPNGWRTKAKVKTTKLVEEQLEKEYSACSHFSASQISLWKQIFVYLYT